MVIEFAMAQASKPVDLHGIIDFIATQDMTLAIAESLKETAHVETVENEVAEDVEQNMDVKAIQVAEEPNKEDGNAM